MKGLLRLAVLLALGVFFAMAKPSPPPPPPTEDLQLRSFLRALENYISKKSVNTDGRLRSNGGQDNSLERDELSPSDEEEAESQSVLIGNKEVKPKNLHPNKEQEKDDSKDKHPLPPVVGIKKAIETRNFGISKSVLWPDGVIPYELSADTFGSRYSKALALVESTAANISRTTCVKWRPKTSADQYFVKITGNQNGCYSYVGNIKRDNGQDLNLGEGCLDEYVVLHEMHHAMGGLHEQQRNRRKYFVKINWENIVSNYNDQYALNMHTKNNEVYDYASILQYHLTAFTSNGKATMTIPDQNLEFLISESKYDLSFYDMAEVNKEYGCPSASCTVSCQNGGFRMQALDQSTCHCHCPSGLKGATCEELDTDAGCGKTINLSNGGSEEITMTSYSSGKSCTWLVKGESDSLIKATVTSVDLPFSSQDDCYHWIELRYYLIGDKGKEICGKSTTPRTYSQTNTGEASPFLIRFNSQKSHTPGAGFTVKVEAVKSGCISSPCKTGSLCTEGSGDGSYTCSCQNGLSGKNCDEFRAPSYNLCNLEEDFGTCLFDQNPSSDILWSFNTRLCSWSGCSAGTITRGSGYQFLTMTPFYDSVQWDYGSKAVLKTTARFTAVDRCLSFVYSFGSFEDRGVQTELNVYVEGTGKTKTKVKNLKTTTNYSWKTETVSVEAVENLVISIEGVIGPQLLGVDNISLRPGLCTNTPCNPNPCINGGTCDGSNPPSGSKYVCTCPTGFSGDRCENSQTSNPCDSNTCQNGATCVADATKTDGYRCDCATGFTGDKCEIPVTTNPCEGNTCRNGATCVAESTKAVNYRCDCAAGFTGDKNKIESEMTTNPCSGNTCQNGATCVADATKTDGYRCDCATGFIGDKCETTVPTNPCDGNTCQNGATCVADATKTDGYRCDCATGFTGDKCETPVPTNPCDSNTCQNGATCVADATKTEGYRCDCATGFTGDKCDVTVNPCDNNDCQNTASCVADATDSKGYRCLCPSGFTGEKCEITVNPCDNNDCQNTASCVADATDSKGYRCLCPSGFTGGKCEITVNPCDNNDCQNTASCVADATDSKGYRCLCPSGFTGGKCEITANPCDNNGCQNFASCVADATDYKGYRCLCPSGFTGEKCEIQDYCYDFRCKNGGTCTSGTATFSCQCTSDYTGPTCDTSLTTDPCDPHPCQNGGSCFSFSFGYYCSCPIGFSGDECEISIPSDHCSSSPCQNGGSCVETPNEQNPYRCDCQQGFPGRNCEGHVCVFEEYYDSACFLDTDPSAWRRSSEGSSVPAFEGHHYLYLDTSWLSLYTSYFYDKNIAFEDKDYCLTFAYYMSGEDAGDLMVFTYKDDYQVHFKKQGTQGNQWHRAHLDIHLDQQTFIGFQGTDGSSGHYLQGSNSLIAMDDVKLMPNRCP